ncbi:MAG: LuxR family transcriptional regulator [Lachnospiraceae bacterium]|nr:LuxR family transcriptional regulator [Lachnospiraceae bacterium]
MEHFCYLGGICIAVICIFLVEQHGSYEMILAAGLIFFVLLGVMGSGIHYLVFVVRGDGRHLGKMMGTAYALGIFFQFVNNHFVGNETAQALVLSMALLLFVILFMRLENEAQAVQGGKTTEEGQGTFPGPKRTLAAGISLITCVILMTCIFSTLDIAVTMVHAAGSADIGRWPRLLLAVSGMAAGILYDIKDRQYMTVMMYCVTLLSTICVVVIQMGGPFLAGLVVFYLSAGFFVVFFTVGFLDFAQYAQMPEFWAGIGRAVNNLCAVLTSSLSVALLELGNGMALIIATLLLFVGITVAIYIYQSQLRRQSPERAGIMEMDDVAKFAAFSQSFSLTDREQEVLKVSWIRMPASRRSQSSF